MFVAASPDLTGKWLKFRAALDAAALPHTGKQSLPLSPIYLLEIAGAQHELDTALASAPGPQARAMPVIDPLTGKIGFEVIW